MGQLTPIQKSHTVYPTVDQHWKPDTKSCYLNAFDYITAHVDSDCRYVLGIIEINGKSFEHAWVSIGDQNIEIMFKDNTMIKYEKTMGVPLDQLLDFVCAIGYPPTIYEISILEHNRSGTHGSAQFGS